MGTRPYRQWFNAHIVGATLVVAPSAGACVGGICGRADTGVRPYRQWFNAYIVGATPRGCPVGYRKFGVVLMV
jgi:hypothetical protein